MPSIYSFCFHPFFCSLRTNSKLSGNTSPTVQICWPNIVVVCLYLSSPSPSSSENKALDYDVVIHYNGIVHKSLVIGEKGKNSTRVKYFNKTVTTLTKAIKNS